MESEHISSIGVSDKKKTQLFHWSIRMHSNIPTKWEQKCMSQWSNPKQKKQKSPQQSKKSKPHLEKSEQIWSSWANDPEEESIASSSTVAQTDLSVWDTTNLPSFHYHSVLQHSFSVSLKWASFRVAVYLSTC